MAKLQSTINTQGYSRIVLEEDAVVGTYIYIYETPQSAFPERDYLQDSTLIAQDICRDDYGIPLSSWLEVTE